jgi:hypothetical protein
MRHCVAIVEDAGPKTRLASGFLTCRAVSPPVMTSTKLCTAHRTLWPSMRAHGPKKAARFQRHASFCLENDHGVAADLREHTIALIALPAAVHAAK